MHIIQYNKSKTNESLCIFSFSPVLVVYVLMFFLYSHAPSFLNAVKILRLESGLHSYCSTTKPPFVALQIHLVVSLPPMVFQKLQIEAF